MAAVTPAPRIEGDGTPDAVWRAWPGLAAVAEMTLERLVPPTRRLVVVAPHPDDEVLACGGLLALHAARGGTVAIVAVTDGEASHAGASPGALGARRRAESLEGLKRLGLTNVTVERFALPDGRVHNHAADLCRRLCNVLRRGDVIVGTWRHDGHPDHDTTGRSIATACASTGARLLEAPVWMWHWASPGDSRVPWGRMMALPLPPSIQLRKRHALHAHASQLEPRGDRVGPVLGRAIRDRAGRAHEYFFR